MLEEEAREIVNLLLQGWMVDIPAEKELADFFGKLVGCSNIPYSSDEHRARCNEYAVSILWTTLAPFFVWGISPVWKE